MKTKDSGIVIHGNVYSEMELDTRFQKHGFAFSTCQAENGVLLYFSAKLFK